MASSYDKELLDASLKSNDEFVKIMKKKFKDSRISHREFSKISSISLSSLNKLLSGKRDIRLSTFRQVVNAFWKIDNPFEDQRFIAVIGARSTIDKITTKYVFVDDEKFHIKEYPSATFEDAVKAAVKAEREGALALVCAPIVSEAVENIVSIPISAMYIDEKELMKAIKLAALKATRP